MFPDRTLQVPWQRFPANASSKLLEFADTATSRGCFECLEALEALAIRDIALIEAVSGEGKRPQGYVGPEWS